MRQKGRKSAKSAEVMPIVTVSRPHAPDDLTNEEKTLFNEIVAARPADYFDSATVPMLVEYCRTPTELNVVAEALARYEADWLNTTAGLKRFKDLTAIRDRGQKRMATLATKMRLAQQSRYENRVKAMRPEQGGAKPWEG